MLVTDLLRLLAVALLLIGAAKAPSAFAGSDSPHVTAHLRVGYGLSVTARPGWVPVTYRDKTWWVLPADIVR